MVTDNPFLIKAILGSSFIGITVAILLAKKVLAFAVGDKSMQAIAESINLGANTYLKRQFKTIVFVVIFLSFFLYFTAPDEKLALGRTIAFIVGAFFSALIGSVGMNIATRAALRVAHISKKSYKMALELSLQAGAITGLLTVGLGLLGTTIIFAIYQEKATQVLVGFGFGGSLLALFMRVGGGIYTKAADIGADLVGKIEKGIPEDDPRNPAVIADLVGDNVGDCAGMAADLFESYAVVLVAAMILGGITFGTVGVLFPLLVAALGVLTSVLGVFLVRVKEEGDGMNAIIRAFIFSSLISTLGFFLLGRYFAFDLRFFWAATIGIVLSVLILLLTEYFTGRHQPVKEIVEKTQTGAATTILAGLTTGFESTVWALLVIAVAVSGSLLIFESSLEAAYGVALSGIGMLAITGLIISMDSFGPIADNAQGIAEMGHVKGKALKILPKLDVIGNTTKATTKGFAIASAVIAAISLFESFMNDAGLSFINVGNPNVFVGFLIGGSIPFLFSALTIQAVSRSSFSIIKEVRRQFTEIKGLMRGAEKPDYAKIVDICTSSALSGLLTPALIAILVPIIVGLLLKAESLGGFLAGSILTGQLLAVFMATSGGAWDNAKKIIEEGIYGGKGSKSHQASVIGDTVGDPLKDTAGPAMNPLIKVMSLISLLIAPLIIQYQKLNLPSLVFLLASLTVIGILLFKQRLRI